MRVETSGNKFGKWGASVSCSGYSVYACSETVIELERTPTFNCDQDCSVRPLTVGHRCQKMGTRLLINRLYQPHKNFTKRANVCNNNVVPVFKCDCGVPAIWNQINVFQYSIFLTDNLYDKKHKMHSTISFPSLIAADFTFDGIICDHWGNSVNHWILGTEWKVLLNTNKNLINQSDYTGCLVALYLTYPCNIVSVDKFFQLL